MNRRSLLITPAVALGGAALLNTRFSAALAQTQAQTQPGSLTAASYTASLLRIGTLSIGTSDLARQRSTNTFVRAFAEGELDEQIAIGQSLQNTAKPKPAVLNAAQRQALESVQNASDTDFDTTYLNVQLTGHKNLLALNHKFLGPNPVYDEPLVHTALVGQAFVKNHIYILEQLLAANQ